MSRVRGFSMVELMVAITLALIVTTGVISVFVGSRSAYQATSGTAELTDGGRFALNFISNSVRSAGYMACTTASHMQGILNAGSVLQYGFNETLSGYEAVGTGLGTAYAVAAPAGRGRSERRALDHDGSGGSGCDPGRPSTWATTKLQDCCLSVRPRWAPGDSSPQ